MSIRCEIVSQDRQVFAGEADMVIVPGIQGEMGILPNHAPLLSTLKFGILRVRYQGQEQIFTIAGGVIEVQPDLITVMADAAENVHEIDINRAEAAKRRAEEFVKQGLPADSDAYLKIESALRRSNLRLQAVKRYRGQRTRFPGTSEEPPK
jgi:F-type H+-transporting ATPase subunit epsilon